MTISIADSNEQTTSISELMREQESVPSASLGSDNTHMARWRWGLVRKVVGKILEFECPLNGDRFGGVDGVKITPPPGLSAYGYLSKQMPAVPKAALPHPGDDEINKSSVVIYVIY